MKTFAKNENYFQIRSPKITALLCPFPALSHAETPRFSRNCVKSNIVGYTTIDAPAAGNYKALSVAFDNVGSAKTYPIATLITCDAPKGGASALATADQIWLWDTTGNDWVKYFYLKKGTQPAVGWCKKGETTVTTDSVPAGQGFFFYRGTGGATDKITFTYDAN